MRHDSVRHHLTLYDHATVAGHLHHSLDTDAHRSAVPEELPGLLGASLPPWLRNV